MAGNIPQQFLDELLSRVDLIEVMSPRITLKKKGNNYSGLCPFHSEKTPSFSANQSKQFYYCFGCGASGNAIGFLMNYDKLPFREAVAQLAQIVGMEIPEESRSDDQNNTQPIYKCLEQAREIYQKNLKTSSKAIEYLKSRGLSGNIAKDYNIGYAPDEWHFIIDKIVGRKPPQNHPIHKTGLINEKNGHIYDKFRDRVIFPIRNLSGKTVGFGGRIIGQGEPKYLNSPETEVFHKKNELYGLYEARKSCKELNQLLVTEGYMDVIALAEHGIKNAVATLGTAVTRQHIQKLLRYVENIVFCFDGDNAGKKAAWKAFEISLPFMRDGLLIKFLFLEHKEDPDSFVKKFGKDAFLEKVNNAVPLTDYMFGALRKNCDLKQPEGKAMYAKRILGYLKEMPEGVYKHILSTKLSEEISIPIDKFELFLKQDNEGKTENIVENAAETSQDDPVDERTLSLLLQYPEIVTDISIDDYRIKPYSRITKLFLKIFKTFSQNPEFTIANLIQSINSDKNHALQNKLVKLASTEHLISQSGVKQEIIGGLNRMQSHSLENEITFLMQKQKNSGLNDQEKQLLQTLIMQKQKANSRA